MTYLALNLMLTLVWMFLSGNFGIGGVAFGFLVGFLTLVVGQPFLGSGGYVRAVVGTVRLLGIFFYEMIVANLQLARDILRPVPRFKPGFIRFDASRLTPAQTVLLGNMISLTPGTLTVDTSDDGHSLYVHTVYAQDPEKIRDGFRLFEGLILGASGRPEAPGGTEVVK